MKEIAKRGAADEDAKRRLAELKAPLEKLHADFLARLSSAGLDEAQVEKVKDAMTYNVVHVTYDAFCRMLPNLTGEQKDYILTTLKTAREEAMDGGSSEEKHAVFGRYKGRINNYLSKQGYDLKQATKDWQERERGGKPSASRAATQPRGAEVKWSSPATGAEILGRLRVPPPDAQQQQLATVVYLKNLSL